MPKGHRPVHWRFLLSMSPWLDRLGGGGLAEWWSWVCGSTAQQALGAQACGVNIVQDCAGLGDMAPRNGDCICLYLQCGWPWGMAWQSRDLARLCRPWGPGWQSRDSAGLWGTAQQNRAPAELCRPGGVCGLAEIINVYGSLALRAHPTEILLFWGVWVWGSTGLVGQRSRARGSEIPWCMEQQLRGLMGWGWACSTCYSFSLWWRGEASQELRVWSADVSALPDVLPRSSRFPASYRDPWIMEVRRSVAVFQSPSWIFPLTEYLNVKTYPRCVVPKDWTQVYKHRVMKCRSAVLLYIPHDSCVY
jgi:hypothetical protein